MKILVEVARWLVILFVALLALATYLADSTAQSLILAAVIFLLLPWTRTLAEKRGAMRFATLGRPALLVLFLALFVVLSSSHRRTSIYRSPELKQQVEQLYGRHLDRWPGVHESRFITTRYGRVHVIVGGPPDAPPILCLHAAAMGGMSWAENAAILTNRYRIYAIDNPGEANLSSLVDASVYPNSGKDLGALYSEVADSLGVGRAAVIAASNGGFIGLNLALYDPGRVQALVLLGPMGFTPLTARSILMMTITSMYPFGFVRNTTTRWALGADPVVLERYGEWFDLIMQAAFPAIARPEPLTSEQKTTIKMPVLLFLGTDDNLVGDPETARAAALEIPGIDIMVVESGHLIGVEKAEDVNAALVEFLSEKYPAGEVFARSPAGALRAGYRVAGRDGVAGSTMSESAQPERGAVF